MMLLINCNLIVISIFLVLHVDAVYNEQVFLSNRTKRSTSQHWVEDGCTAVGSACVGSFQEKSYLAGVRCCSDDGTICETPGRCPADNMNFDDATNKCNDLGKRLCTRDELLTGICCSTGGNCDVSEVWTSPGGCILSGIDFHGGDIGVAVVKDTKEMCQKHCQDTSGCLYFTWVDDTHPSSWNHKKCFLKNALIESKAGEGIYSGPKFCQDWTKEEHKFCRHCSTFHQTFEESKSACANDLSCEAVYDLFCDGIGNFCTCKALYVVEQPHPKGMDCIHRKP